MTNSPVADAVAPGSQGPGSRRPGKRERLVAGACRVFYEQGVERTTIADVARAADVPVGNVYYYFKTKDDIIAAVVDSHRGDVETAIAAIDEHHRTPAARLKALLHALAEQGELIARYGCPLGTLCS
jgi:AcrR family transcriptional regulator